MELKKIGNKRPLKVIRFYNLFLNFANESFSGKDDFISTVKKYLLKSKTKKL